MTLVINKKPKSAAWKMRVAVVTMCSVLTFTAVGTAHADPRGRNHHYVRHVDRRDYRGRPGYVGGYYAPPPVVYSEPAYAPPPVVYAPEPGIGLNINIR